MDMKKILRTIDNASIEGSSSDMQRLRNIVEGKGPLNRSTPAESIAMQHYAEPKKTITAPVLNVQEDARPSMIGKYFKAVEEELQESAQRGNLRTRQLAERVTTRLNELSTATLASYKKKAGADASKADKEGDFERGNKRFKGINKATIKQFDNDTKKEKGVAEEWSKKYKSSINCSHPKGFSQKAHCAGKKKHNEDITLEMTCPDCGMCETHGNLNEIKKGSKDSNGVTKCWPGKHAEGTKKGKNGGQVRNCVPNEGIDEADMGKHNNATTGFKALAKKAGGGEKGARIAGAQFQKMKKAGQLEEQGVPEMAIAHNPADANNPMIHGHEKANSMNLKDRIAQARAQLKELAQLADSNELVVWEKITRLSKGGMFMGLEQNLEQVRHGINELVQARKTGKQFPPKARGNIDKNIG